MKHDVVRLISKLATVTEVSGFGWMKIATL